MSRTHYDTTQPRISIRRPFEEDAADPYHTEREIGQAEATNEAMFWLTLGYSVHFSRVDEKRGIFVDAENYYPGDL